MDTVFENRVHVVEWALVSLWIRFLKVTGLYKDALTRKVAEAVKINDTPTPNLINTKAEFGHNKLTRLQLTTD